MTHFLSLNGLSYIWQWVKSHMLFSTAIEQTPTEGHTDKIVSSDTIYRLVESGIKSLSPDDIDSTFDVGIYLMLETEEQTESRAYAIVAIGVDGSGNSTQQKLYKDKYFSRTYNTTESEWGEWTENIYSIAGHTHAISDVTNLASSLIGKMEILNIYSLTDEAIRTLVSSGVYGVNIIVPASPLGIYSGGILTVATVQLESIFHYCQTLFYMDAAATLKICRRYKTFQADAEWSAWEDIEYADKAHDHDARYSPIAGSYTIYCDNTATDGGFTNTSLILEDGNPVDFLTSPGVYNIMLKHAPDGQGDRHYNTYPAQLFVSEDLRGNKMKQTLIVYGSYYTSYVATRECTGVADFDGVSWTISATT